MDTVSILTETLVNILLGTFSLLAISAVLGSIQAMINEHRQEKRRLQREEREIEQHKRDAEYHQKRMENLLK